MASLCCDVGEGLVLVVVAPDLLLWSPITRLVRLIWACTLSHCVGFVQGSVGFDSVQGVHRVRLLCAAGSVQRWRWQCCSTSATKIATEAGWPLAYHFLMILIWTGLRNMMQSTKHVQVLDLYNRNGWAKQT